MKKVLILLLVILVSFFVFKEVTDYNKEGKYIQSFKKEFNEKRIFYEHIDGCKPYTVPNDEEYIVHGKKGDECHVSMLSLHCYFPDEIAGIYSKGQTEYIDDKLSEMSKGSVVISTSEPNYKYLKDIENFYCKLVATEIKH